MAGFVLLLRAEHLQTSSRKKKKRKKKEGEKDEEEKKKGLLLERRGQTKAFHVRELLWEWLYWSSGYIPLSSSALSEHPKISHTHTHTEKTEMCQFPKQHRKTDKNKILTPILIITQNW